MKLKNFFMTRTYPTDLNLALFLLRFYVGIAFIFHGWGKIQNPFGWMGPDAAVPGFLLGLAALAEFGGGISLILGLLTRLSALGLICTMAVAASFHIMKGDPWVSMGGASAEPALVFFFVAILLFVSGPGKYSLDSKIFGNTKLKV